MKSNLNRPLKFLIRLVSSFLPNVAIEVASLSKYLFDVIPITFAKTVSVSSISWIFVTCIVLQRWRLMLETRRDRSKAEIGLLSRQIFFVISQRV